MQNSIERLDVRHRRRRSRIHMLIVLVLILLVTGLLFAYMLNLSAKRAAEHKHSFMEYVTTHHLGDLTEIDTGTGLDPMSYILTLNHVLPDADRTNFALDLSQRYFTYDRGQQLTIVYVDPSTHKQYPVAETHYDRQTKKLTLNVTSQSGQTTQTVLTVHW